MATFTPKFGPAMTAVLLAAAFSSSAQAQRPIGTVSTTDASVGGVLETSGGTATIVNNGTVTAHEQTATVTLARGGKVNVCATSVVHLSQSAATPAGGPMLVALDRGAIELSYLAGTSDALLTPDMRMQPMSPGPLDLRIRVVPNGDTCVENLGNDAPALMITDTFGESSYVLHARQHVLFEHGSLKQVVDNESSACGCPPPVVISVAEGGVSGTQVAQPGSTVASADTHPFPEAESEGLTAAPPPQKPALGHVSADLALTYNSTQTAQPATGASAATAAAEPAPATAVASSPAPAQPVAPIAAPVKAQAPPPPPPPTNDLAHIFVRFYRWVFHRKN